MRCLSLTMEEPMKKARRLEPIIPLEYLKPLSLKVCFLNKKVKITENRFIKYTMIGGSSAAIDWSLFYVLAIILDIHYLLAGTISFTLATFFNYFIGITFLFNSTVRFTKNQEVILVFLISTVGLGINLFFLFLFSTWFSFDLMISKIMSSFFTLAWNFSMRNYYVFRDPTSDNKSTSPTS